MQAFRIVMVALAVCTTAPGTETGAEPSDLRMNQVQVIGTHNSYHQRPSDVTIGQVKHFHSDAQSWTYEHAPLDVQLDRGVRSFELDLHNMPQGIEVFHVPFGDTETSCRRFTDCLHVVRDWSDAHPGHLPISFLLEIKDEPAIVALSPAMPVDAATLDQIDADVRSVFVPDRLITPDDVRGDVPTLSEAVRTKGWPRLDDARDKVFVILHETGKNRDLYTAGRPSLEGRPMFVRSDEGRPDAATMVLDNPNDAAIPRLVREGYLIRTRADGGLRHSEDRKQAAIESGAQIVSTDFPPGEADTASGYVLDFPEGMPFRANPVNAGHIESRGRLESAPCSASPSEGARETQ
jgi:hypothetical protein